ncbi:hypothetical protein MRX96_028744 [Rhipicephalus microplus]
MLSHADTRLPRNVSFEKAQIPSYAEATAIENLPRTSPPAVSSQHTMFAHDSSPEATGSTTSGSSAVVFMPNHELRPISFQEMAQTSSWLPRRASRCSSVHQRRWDKHQRFQAPSIGHMQRSQSMIPQRRPSRTARERIVTNCLLYQNVGELQHMIKQSAKERLQLERQVAHLHQAIRLQKERIEHEYRLRLRDVEDRLKEQESQLTQLQKDLDDRCEISADLERQLLEALEQKIEVEAQNATLEEEVTRLRTAETELRVRSAELEAARGEASALEALVGHLRQAADQRRLLERQHAQALQEVRAAKAAAAAAKGSAEAAQQLTIQTLESRVRELQKKCELQNVLHEELVLEMAALRRQQMQQQRTRSARESWRAGRSLSAEVRSGHSGCSVK